MRDDATSRPEEAFQQLLLRFSAATAEDASPEQLIRLFCSAARESFGVDGVYFWRRLTKDELVGAEAEGYQAEQFRGLRLKADQPSLSLEAITERHVVVANHVDPARSQFVLQFQVQSAMAAPLIVANEVIGAAVFIHRSLPEFFTEDMAAKAAILASQVGSVLEASRLRLESMREHRRSQVLADVALSLHGSTGDSALLESIAERLRVLLGSRLVCILVSQGTGFTLRTVAAESMQLADTARARHDRRGLQFASEVAMRAVNAGEPISVAIDPTAHSLADLVPAGVLIAAPFRTPRTQGAALVYPREGGPFTQEEKSLAAAVANFGGMALANAELYATARAQAHELHQLLDIASELGSIGQLDEFMQQFALRASEFLGFGRAFLGLIEPGGFRVRWAAQEGGTQRADYLLPDGPMTRALRDKEIFWSDDVSKVQGIHMDLVAQYRLKQLLTVPLLGSDGHVLGMFGVLDRVDGIGISPEDIRRARALATQATVALELTRDLDVAEKNRRQSESLMSLAGELNSQLELGELAQIAVQRTAALIEAPGAALVVKQESGWETVAWLGPLQPADLRQAAAARLAQAAADIVERRNEAVLSGVAGELLGPAVTQAFQWESVVLVRLAAPNGEFSGVLCLANRPNPLTENEQRLLQAIAGHAAIAVHNAQRFTRMDRANRHWIDIYDAISDFIVVHDESGSVLRVNRSLAEFIGVSPKELIGVKIGALLALDTTPSAGLCPFCRSGGEAPDEYVHPGSERTYLVSSSRVHGDSGEHLQTIHVLKDISDRREAERRYRELFSNIQEGLFFATPDGRFVEVNDALVRMLGYSSREELLLSDIRAQIFSSAEQYEELAAQMQEHGVARNREETLRRKDGTPVYVLINAFAVRDSQERIVQYRGLMLDVSGSKAYQAELQRERDFSGKILNNTQNLILVADSAGVISYANRRWYDLGYQQNQLLGRPMSDLVVPSRRENLSQALHSVFSGHHVDNLDLQVLRGDGTVGHFSVNLNPMRDEQGNVGSLVVVMTDVTDAATLQAKLMHAEKMAAVGQLVSGVAHEVNNPLTAILGFADLLMENGDLPESVRRDLRVILQEAQRTKQIVQNLLSFARQMPPQRRPVQLNSILRRTVQLRSYDFHSHGLDVAEQFDESLPEVVGDSQQLQQVFLNILNNAYDAVRDTGRPPRIEIVTGRNADFVEVWFRDNGHGIKYADRIFDPFFTTKEIGKGTGLGLSICYGIVHEHGGEILCHNNSDSEGATFIVRLPAATGEALGAAAGVNQP